MIFFASFLLGAVAFKLWGYFPASTLIVSIAALALAKKRPLPALLFLAGVLVAFVNEPANIASGTEVVISGSSESEPRDIERGFSQVIAVRSVNDASGKPIGFSPDSLVLYSDEPLVQNTIYELACTLHFPERMGPGDSGKPYASLKAVLDTKPHDPGPLERARSRLNSFFGEEFAPDEAALLMALTTGERASMSHEMNAAFASSGLAHLLSISGTHFGLFSVLLFAAFRLVIYALPYGALERLSAYATPKQASALLSLPFMIMYLGLSGGSIPAVRSFIMISLFLIGLLIGRKRHWLSALLLAASLIVLWDPASITDISFLLSFSAVFFIGAFVGEGRKEDARQSGNRAVNILKNAVFVSLAASLGTAPIVAYFFGRVSLIAPVSNMIVTPIVGFILVPFSLVSSFIYLATGFFPLQGLIEFIAVASTYLTKALASFEYAELRAPAFPIAVTVAFYISFALSLFKRRLAPVLILPILLLAVHFLTAPPASGNLTAAFLGSQGESSVVSLPDGRILVIDAGKTGLQTASCLRGMGKKEIDALALTHNHSDHAGGAMRITEEFNVKDIWVSELFDTSALPLTREPKRLGRGDIFNGAGYEVMALHPYSDYISPHGDIDRWINDTSLVLKISARRSFLFAGDIETPAEEDIIHLGKLLKSDVLKVPHHGLKSAVHSGFLNAVSPLVAVASSNKPAEGLVQSLSGSALYLTGRDGAVKVTDSPSGLSVRRYADYRLSAAHSLLDEARNIRNLFVVW